MAQFYEVAGKGYNDLLRRRRFDKKSIANDIFASQGSTSLQLILGIDASGASSLLLSNDDAAHLLQYNFGPRDAVSASAFKSLSPIFFTHSEQLAKKLSKIGTNNKKYHGNPDGTYRAMFEHCRILHRALLGDVGSPSRFGLTTGHLINLRTLRIVSLAFSYWLDTVTVADVGYVETGVGSLTPLSTHHIIIQSNSHLGERISFVYGETETLGRDDLAARMHSLFSSETPTCLLVCGQERAKAYLKECGIAVSDWHIGLGPFFNYSLTERSFRSHAPHMRSQTFLVDVRALCTELFQSAQNTDNPRHMAAHKLRLPVDKASGMCAGNDSRILLDVFLDMASGNAIDEQRECRRSAELAAPSSSKLDHPPVAPQTGGNPTDVGEAVDADDAEIDPNNAPIPVVDTDDDYSDYSDEEY